MAAASTSSLRLDWGVDHLDGTYRADLGFRVDAPQQRNGFVFRQRDVVAHLIDVLQILLGVRFVVAAEHPRRRGDELFVDGGPQPDAAFEMGEADLGVPQVGIHHPAAAPAAEGVHRRLRALEVVEGHKGLDAFFQQIVDEFVVESKTLGVGGAGIVRHDAAPGKAHPVDLQPQFGHQVHVLFPVVVVVGGHLVVRNAGAVGPQVGGGGTFAPLTEAAFHLERAGGGTPEEILREGMMLVLHKGFLLGIQVRSS